MAEAFSVVPLGPSVLFSGLFCVAASRLNSPRCSVAIESSAGEAVKIEVSGRCAAKPFLHVSSLIFHLSFVIDCVDQHANRVGTGRASG